MILKGERVLIRYFENSDLEDFFEFSKRPEVGFSAGWKPHTDYDLSRRVLHGKVLSASNFAIVLKDTQKVIGSIELNPSHIREKIRAFEIGFALNPDYWGHGYVSEATRLLMNYAFKKMNAAVLEMCHFEDNIRSERVCKAVGFRYEGTLKAYKQMYDGRIVDVKLYSMTLDEYERMYL